MLAALSPSPLVGEGWGGGDAPARVLSHTPHPNPPPQGGREKETASEENGHAGLEAAEEAEGFLVIRVEGAVVEIDRLRRGVGVEEAHAVVGDVDLHALDGVPHDAGGGPEARHELVL